MTTFDRDLNQHDVLKAQHAMMFFTYRLNMAAAMGPLLKDSQIKATFDTMSALVSNKIADSVKTELDAKDAASVEHLWNGVREALDTPLAETSKIFLDCKCDGVYVTDLNKSSVATPLMIATNIMQLQYWLFRNKEVNPNIQVLCSSFPVPDQNCHHRRQP